MVFTTMFRVPTDAFYFSVESCRIVTVCLSDDDVQMTGAVLDLNEKRVDGDLAPGIRAFAEKRIMQLAGEA
ncbi:hypothetical protein ACUSIJ_10385 [Pseudochelatococcus sp. B33]